MARIDPISIDTVPELADIATNLENRFGFLPNDLMTMARRPKVLKAFLGLTQAINDPSGSVPQSLKRCISHIAARTAGCHYCQAHSASIASDAGVADDKIAAIWEFETSPLFDDAERAALSFAQASAAVPNLVTDEDIENLHKYFDDDQIVEILFVVCHSAFFTRWNDSLATSLEDHGMNYASQHLSPSGWTPGKHT